MGATALRSSELQFSSLPALMVTKVPSSTLPKTTTRNADGNVLFDRQCVGSGEHMMDGEPVVINSPRSPITPPRLTGSWDESNAESSSNEESEDEEKDDVRVLHLKLLAGCTGEASSCSCFSLDGIVVVEWCWTGRPGIICSIVKADLEFKCPNKGGCWSLLLERGSSLKDDWNKWLRHTRF